VKSKRNYVILSEKSEFLRNLVIKFIVKLNIDDKVYPQPSLFGQHIIVSDHKDPNAKQFVISHKRRTDEGWHVIDLDSDPLPTLYEMLEINSRECKLFIRNKVYGRGSALPNTLYYYCVLLRGCIIETPEGEENGFNHTKANLIIDNYNYKSTSSALDKYKALNSYVVTPTEESLFTLVKVFSNTADQRTRMKEIAYCIKNILDGAVPNYIESRVQFSNDMQVMVQYLILATEVATFEDFSVFISNLIGKLA
jgi:hypothetical protein